MDTHEPDEDALYLASLASMTSSETIRAATMVWQSLREIAGTQFPSPAACLGDEGQISLCWDDGPHHLAAEVFADGRILWNYNHRQDGDRIDCESLAEDALPPAITRTLLHFMQ